MVFPKFIIETDIEGGDCLIIAKCTRHKQLVTDITKTKGGGWWKLDTEKNVFTLHGDSVDLGRAKVDDIARCVQNKKVYSTPALLGNLTDEYSFQYEDQCGEIINLLTYLV